MDVDNEEGDSDTSKSIRTSTFAPSEVDKALEPEVSEIRKIDPDDGKACSFQELSEKYGKTFSKEAVLLYWDNDCKPVSDPIVGSSSSASGGEPSGASTQASTDVETAKNKTDKAKEEWKRTQKG